MRLRKRIQLCVVSFQHTNQMCQISDGVFAKSNGRSEGRQCRNVPNGMPNFRYIAAYTVVRIATQRSMQIDFVVHPRMSPRIRVQNHGHIPDADILPSAHINISTRPANVTQTRQGRQDRGKRALRPHANTHTHTHLSRGNMLSTLRSSGNQFSCATPERRTDKFP